MDLALLGINEDSFALAAAAVAEGHTFSWIDPSCDRAWRERLEQIGIPPSLVSTWEQLLDTDGQPVILGRNVEADDETTRIEQLKALARSGVAVLVVHPICDSLLATLEIDMLATESNGLVQIFPSHGLLATVGPLQSAIAEIGPMEHVHCTRYLENRTALAVTRAFASDVCLLERLSGEFRRITAVGVESTAADYSNLTVQLGMTDSRVAVQWKASRPTSDPGLLLEVTGERGTARLESAPSGSEWAWIVTRIRPPEPPETIARLESATIAKAAMEAFVDRTRGQASTAHDAPIAGWDLATRSMELSDSIEISLRRGRTIELFYQRLTESTTFRGAMSVAGCALLVLLPILIVIVGLLGDLFGLDKILGEGFGVQLIRHWYVPVLVLLVAFLGLQLLPKLLGPPGSGPRQAEPETQADGSGKRDKL